MKKICFLFLLAISFNLLALDKTEIINTKTVTTSQVEVHAKVIPIFNVKQTKSLEFKQLLSGTTVEKDQVITITDDYNAPIQLVFPTEAEIKTDSNKTMIVNLNSPEEMVKFINTNGSRDIIVRGTIVNDTDSNNETYKGSTTFKIKYD